MYIVIVGCGNTGRSLAQELSRGIHNVVGVDKNERSLALLGERFNGMSVLGDALALDILEEAGIKGANALFAVTRDDNLNLVVAEIAKIAYKVEKSVALVEESQKADIFKKKGIECISRTQTLLNIFKQCIS